MSISKYSLIFLFFSISVFIGDFNYANANNDGFRSDWTPLISDMAVQSDGKIIVGGHFTSYNGEERKDIVRLNPDGTLDTSFDPGAGFTNISPFADLVQTIAIQPDGKIIIGGNFTSYNGITRKGIARINSDGTLDTSFDPGISINGTEYGIASIAIQSDGKIIIGGNFTSYNGITRKGIARINSDGTLDTTFDVGEALVSNTSWNIDVITIAIQSDNKIIIGGGFALSSGSNGNNIARINTDGTLDTTFDIGIGIGENGSLFDINIQSDNKIIIAGQFTSYNGIARNGIARINTDGTLDTSFDPGLGVTNRIPGMWMVQGSINSFAIQSDGKILILGNFTYYNGITRNGVARINSDGTLDTSFAFENTQLNPNVKSIAVQPSGKITIGGLIFIHFNSDGTYDLNFNTADLNSNGGDEVTDIVIKTSPAKSFYDIGEQLNLAGLVVTLTKLNNEIIDIPYEEFSKYGITTYLMNITKEGTIPSLGDRVTQRDCKVAVIVNNHTAWIELNNAWPYKTNLDPIVEKDNLVIITHGWNASGDSEWLEQMKNGIDENSTGSTEVVLFDWSIGANTGGRPFVDTWIPNEMKQQAVNAYSNAVNAGHVLANKIEVTSEKKPIKYLHLIAHSAGSNVIQTVVDDLELYAERNPTWEKPYIHLTFLDAFAPNQENERYGDLHSFSGYAEQYVNTSIVSWEKIDQFNVNDTPDTNIKLPNVVNFDITNLPGSTKTHEWPVQFYINSIDNPDYKIGFIFAKENLNDKPIFQGLKGYICYLNTFNDSRFNCEKTEHTKTVINPYSEPKIDIASNVESIDISSLLKFGGSSEPGGQYSGILPEIILEPRVLQNDVEISVYIPKDTEVTGNFQWNGIISSPVLINLNTETSKKLGKRVNAFDIGGNIFETGLPVNNISFSKAVRILLKGQAGKSVSYSHDNEEFTPISPCNDQQKSAGESLPDGGDCWTIGTGDNFNDLIIWTKHFTTFVTYDEIVTPQTVSGGGGGGGGVYISAPIRPITSTGQTTLTTSGVTIPHSVVVIAKDIKRSIYRDAISTLILKNIIANNNLIYPNRFISRAEFIKILAKANGFVPIQSTKKFADVDSKSELAQYISFGIEKGWINPENENFRPDARITQGEVDKLIATVKGKATTTKKVGTSRFVARGKAMKDIVDAFFVRP